MKTHFGIEQIDEYLNTLRLDKSNNTLIVYTSAIDKLFSFMNINSFEDIRKITPSDIRKHMDHMKSLGMKEKSINTNIRPIKAMFNWLVENEYISKSPMDRVKLVKEPEKLVAFLTEEEQEKIILACKNDLDKLIVAILLSTGLRRDELCKLTLNSYDGFHILIDGKGRKQRSLALQPNVVSLLNKYIEERNNKYGNKTNALFVSKMGKEFTGGAIYKKIKSILNLAKLPQDRVEAIHTHSLRHTFTANILENGNVVNAQFALGHSSPRTTQIYTHLRNTALDRAMLNQKSVL